MSVDIRERKEEFFDDLLTKDLSFVASKWVIDCQPYIFRDAPLQCIMWKEKLSGMIQVDSRSIVITGSGGVGFSLNPTKGYSDFHENSDIDIAVISNHYFDVSWHTLRNLGAKKYSLSYRQKASVQDHVNRLIYWGTIATDKILPILPFAREWDQALTEMKKEKETENRDIKVRIYKDFEALRAYSVNNLNNLKNEILEQQLGGNHGHELLENNS